MYEWNIFEQDRPVWGKLSQKFFVGNMLICKLFLEELHRLHCLPGVNVEYSIALIHYPCNIQAYIMQSNLQKLCQLPLYVRMN